MLEDLPSDSVFLVGHGGKPFDSPVFMIDSLTKRPPVLE